LKQEIVNSYILQFFHYPQVSRLIACDYIAIRIVAGNRIAAGCGNDDLIPSAEVQLIADAKTAHMEVLTGKAVVSQFVEVFLQTEVFCLHDISVRKADIAEVPGFIIDAGYIALLRRIALNKAIFPGVRNCPGIFAVAVKTTAGPIFDVVGIQIDGQARVMLAVTGQDDIGVRVFLTFVVYGVLVQTDLRIIAAPAGDDIDVGFSALRGEGIHPLILSASTALSRRLRSLSFTK